jgi:hypothetical protein
VFDAEGFIVLKDEHKCEAIAVHDFLSADISGPDVLLSVRAKLLGPCVQHFFRCNKGKPLSTSLCVLAHKKQTLSKYAEFSEEHPSSLPMFAFYVLHNKPSAQPTLRIKSALCDSELRIQVEGAPLSMIFGGTANGAAASFMVDSGASDCFMDVSFACEQGIVCKPAKRTVSLADGSTVDAALQTPLRVKIQGYTATVPCFMLDLQQQFDVILGDTWLTQSQATLCYATRTCSIRTKKRQFVLTPNEPEEQNNRGNASLLNGVQLRRALRFSSRVFLVRVREGTDAIIDSAPPPTPPDHPKCSAAMQKLLNDFQEIFQPISSLPPDRGNGHTIPLEPSLLLGLFTV